MREALSAVPGGEKLTVSVRQGSPSELRQLERVCAGTARHIIATPPAGGGQGGEGGDEYAEALQKSTGLAVSLQQNAQPGGTRRASFVAATPSGYSNKLVSACAALGSYAEVVPAEFVSRLLAQCTVSPGLSRVYEELLDQACGITYNV